MAEFTSFGRAHGQKRGQMPSFHGASGRAGKNAMGLTRAAAPSAVRNYLGGRSRRRGKPAETSEDSAEKAQKEAAGAAMAPDGNKACWKWLRVSCSR